jgi:hypothetical protein
MPALAATPAGAAKGPQRCYQLKGKDLFPENPKVRVVAGKPFRSEDRRGRSYTTVVYRSCAGRFGKVRVFSTNKAPSDTIVPYVAEASAGTFFILSQTYTDPGEEPTTELNIHDARGGSSGLHETPSPSDEYPEGSAYFDTKSVVLNRYGRAVAVFVKRDGSGGVERGLPAGTTRYVASFERFGTTVLDAGGSEIVPESLKLRAGVVTWAHGAEKRRYELGR